VSYIPLVRHKFFTREYRNFGDNTSQPLLLCGNLKFCIKPLYIW